MMDGNIIIQAMVKGAEDETQREGNGDKIFFNSQ
jgi:hypothetical protein